MCSFSNVLPYLCEFRKKFGVNSEKCASWGVSHQSVNIACCCEKQLGVNISNYCIIVTDNYNFKLYSHYSVAGGNIIRGAMPYRHTGSV